MKRDGTLTTEISALTTATGLDEHEVRSVLVSLAKLIANQHHTVIRGLGTFEWMPICGRLPNGNKYKSERLVFRSESVRRIKFEGDKHGND